MKQLTIIALFSGAVLAACSNGRQISSDRMDLNLLNGTWQLDSISTEGTSFENLYPDRKPVITFDVTTRQVKGNAGCNSYSGPFTLSGYNVDFNGPLVTTRMACPGNGENVFLNSLKAVTNFAVNDSTTLHLLAGEVPAMRFHKVPVR